MRLSQQYCLQGDLRRASEVEIKVEQLQSRLPRYEQLSLQVLKADRSRDLEAQVRPVSNCCPNFPRDYGAAVSWAPILAT